MTGPGADRAQDCFALLDDCDASADNPRSRLYTGLADMLVCDRSDALPALFEQMAQAMADGLFAVGLFAYELGERMQGVAERASAAPLARVLLFRHSQRMDAGQVDAWLAQAEPAARPAAGIASACPNVDEAAFGQALARIHAYIEAGDTYQVNYTYRLHFDAYGSPIALYRRLRARQPVPYGALIRLPDDAALLSLSPELFVRHDGGTLLAQPMKGTASATGTDAIDAARAAALASDPKNRAENLMIVDLLRNDLGRVARTGSVQVPELFRVARYGKVLQMTSTVRAQLRDGLALADLFAALYPCGSITGAPKRRTMQIIRELETEARGIYTGAIGWFDPPPAGRTVGDFCLSVPIRTLTLTPPRANGTRAGQLGVGAGIVHDSVTRHEWEECALKAGFLTGLAPEFELFETMYATGDGCRHLPRHLQRLKTSAYHFGFVFDEQALREAIDGYCAQLPPPAEHRLRLSLRPDGTHMLQGGPLAPLAVPVRLLVAAQPTDAADIFLRHKTTVREGYDAAWRAAEARGAFDMLFFNRDGKLTEGARSSVFVLRDGRWNTPPLAAGLLPGVMRSVLLDDPAWNAVEAELTRDDLRAAERIVVCNALRGVLNATIDWAEISG